MEVISNGLEEREKTAKEDGKKGGEVRPATFSQLKDKPPEASQGNLDLILDLNLEVSVQLGSTRMLIRDLLQLGHGSVIELSKLAGEPMDVLANDKLIARGEVVVVNEKFGIRLTDIISPADRIKQLK